MVQVTHVLTGHMDNHQHHTKCSPVKNSTWLKWLGPTFPAIYETDRHSYFSATWEIQALFKDPNCIFKHQNGRQKPYPRRRHSNFRLQCDTEVINTVMIKAKFARFKFKDFSRIFKYFQAPYLFSSTFKSLKVFMPNSSIFNDFSSTLWTLWLTTALFCVCLVQDARYCIKSVFRVAIETVKLSFSSYVYDW